MTERSWPSRDPNTPHPGLVFHAGKWRTPEGAENWRRSNAAAVMTYSSTIHGQTVRMMSQLRRDIERKEASDSILGLNF